MAKLGETKTFKRNGRTVTSRVIYTSKEGYLKKRSNSSSKPSSSSSQPSSSSNNSLIATATNLKTGEKSFVGSNNQLFKTEAEARASKSSGSSSKRKPIKVSKPSFDVSITDTRTGVTTQRTIEQGGKVLSSKTITPEQQKRQAFLKKQQQIKQQNQRLLSDITKTKTPEEIQKLKLSNIENRQKQLENKFFETQRSQDIKLNLKNQVQQQVKNNIKSIQNTPEYKKLIKGSVTPEDIKKIEQNIKDAQISLTDIKNIAERQAIGFSKGMIKSVKGTVDIVKNYPKIFKKAHNYGVEIQKRTIKGESNPFLNDVKKLANNTVKVADYVRKNPVKTAVIVGMGAYAIGKSIDNKIKENPAEAIGFLTGEVLQSILGGQLLKILDNNLLKQSSGYIKESKGKWILTDNSKSIYSKTKEAFSNVKNFLTGKKNPIIKKFNEKAPIILKRQTVKSGAMPFIEQVRTFGGKTVVGVNAAMDGLTSLLKRKRLIRKPIPNEDKFPKEIKTLLNKFDNGKKLTIQEQLKVNNYLRKNVAPNITLLERSLYLDPTGGLRTSRLGITKQKAPSLKDLLTLNFKISFKNPKPQVLIFTDLKVAKPPKDILAIVNKIDKKGITYKGFDEDLTRLVDWQNKSGKAVAKPGGSPIYSGGRELEVTIPPNEYIKRIKKLGFTIIDGKKVDFVKAEIYKPPKSLKNKIKKAQDGKLTKSELSKLEKEVSKKLGTKIEIETPDIRKGIRRSKANIPVLRVDLKGIKYIKYIGRYSPKKVIDSRKITTSRKIDTKSTKNNISPRKDEIRKIPKDSRKITTISKIDTRTTKNNIGSRKDEIRKIPIDSRKPKRIIKAFRSSKTIFTEKPLSKIPKIPKLRFDSKELDNRIATYEATFRERKDPRKNFNKKTNPLVTKTIKVRDTKNRVLKRVANRVDNNLARSVEIKPVSLGKAKKDIKKPQVVTKKFRPKKSKNTPVLKLVEKSKYTIDSKTEKGQLKQTRKTSTKKVKTIKRPKPITKKKVVKKVIKKTKNKTKR